MSSMPYSLLQRIKSVFKMAKVVTSDDSTNLRNGWFTYEGLDETRPIKGTLFTPYGMMHNPPASSIAMLFAQEGLESNRIGIADDPKNRTLNGLEEGEVALGNYLTGSYVFFKENGDVLVNANGNIQAIADGNISATAGGDVTVISGGDVSVTASTSVSFDVGGTTFDFTSSGLEITGGDISSDGVSLKTHVHSGVTSGGSNTGGPV